MKVGASVCASNGFNAMKFLELAKSEKITWYSGVPTMHQTILLRANNYIKYQEKEDQKIIDEKIHDEELKKLNGMNNKMLAQLAKENIVTLNDFADLASFELIDKEEGIFKNLDIEEEIINNMIMQAREKWFIDSN